MLKVSLPEVEEVPPYSPQHHHSSVMALYQTGSGGGGGSEIAGDENQPLTQDEDETPSHQTTQMMVTPAVCYNFRTIILSKLHL